MRLKRAEMGVDDVYIVHWLWQVRVCISRVAVEFQKNPHLIIVLTVCFSVTWQLPHVKFAQGGPPISGKHNIPKRWLSELFSLFRECSESRCIVKKALLF